MSYDHRDIEALPLSSIDLESGAKGMFTVRVTPLDAERLLKNNKNRKLNQNTVLRYAMQMERGEWDWCEGDGQLKVGKGGVLRNGQHRLNAQVLANVTGAYDLRTGVPEESYKNMDTNVPRNPADYFYGKEYANAVSALARRICYASRGQVEPTGSMTSVGKDGIPTNIELIGFTESNYAELVCYVKLGKRVRKQNRRGGVSSYAAALYLSGDTLDTISAFVDDYVAGAGETSITKETILKKLVDRNFKPRPHWFCGVTLMALDAWKAGRGVRVFRAPDVASRYKRAVRKYQSLMSDGEEAAS